MKIKHLLSTIIIATLAMVPISANAEEVEVQPTTVAEESVVAQYPEITGFANTATGTKVSWSAYEGADKYRLYYLNGSVWSLVGTTENLTFTHNNLTDNTTYDYTVMAVDSDGNNIGDFNYNSYTNTFYAPPTVSTLTSKLEGIEIKWNKTGSVESYRLYRKTNNSGWSYIGNFNGTSYVDENVDSGNYYAYTVRCLDENLELISSYNNGKTIGYVQAPKVSKIENTATGSKITWSKCAGASKYRVFVYKNNEWNRIGTTTSTSFVHEGLNAGTTYKYTVRCLDSKDKYVSGFNGGGYTNTYIAPPTVASLANKYEGIEVKWNKTNSVENYRLYRKVNNSGWSYIGNFNGTSYVDKNVISGNTYAYTVRCLDENNQLISSYNNGKSIAYVQAPKVTLIENTATGAEITWSKCAGATKYRVFVFENNDWRRIGTTSSTSFVHEGLKNGTTYKYTVRCVDNNDKYVSGYNNGDYTNTFYAPPQISSISKADDGTLIKWNKASGVAGYRLYRKSFGSSWGILASVTDTSYVDTTENKDAVYTYTLRYLDEDQKVISYYVEDEKYYKNGQLCNGSVTIGGKTYRFENGLLIKSGYQVVDGKTYYYNSNGVIQKNCIVGSRSEGYKYASPSGIIIESAEIQAAVDFVIAHGGSGSSSQKLRNCYDYLKNTFVYKRSYVIPSTNAHFRDYALSVFNNKSGNCYAYGIAYACIARVLGYDARAINGQISAAAGGVTIHGWTEIYVNGQWYVYDVNMAWDISYLNFYQVTYATYPISPFYAQEKYNITFNGNTVNWKKV